MEASSVLGEVMRGSEKVAERLSRLHEYKEEKAEVKEEDKGEVKSLTKRLKVEWEGMQADLKSYAQGKNIIIKNEHKGGMSGCRGSGKLGAAGGSRREPSIEGWRGWIEYLVW